MNLFSFVVLAMAMAAVLVSAKPAAPSKQAASNNNNQANNNQEATDQSNNNQNNQQTKDAQALRDAVVKAENDAKRAEAAADQAEAEAHQAEEAANRLNNNHHQSQQSHSQQNTYEMEAAPAAVVYRPNHGGQSSFAQLNQAAQTAQAEAMRAQQNADQAQLKFQEAQQAAANSQAQAPQTVYVQARPQPFEFQNTQTVNTFQSQSQSFHQLNTAARNAQAEAQRAQQLANQAAANAQQAQEALEQLNQNNQQAQTAQALYVQAPQPQFVQVQNAAATNSAIYRYRGQTIHQLTRAAHAAQAEAQRAQQAEADAIAAQQQATINAQTQAQTQALFVQAPKQQFVQLVNPQVATSSSSALTFRSQSIRQLTHAARAAEHRAQQAQEAAELAEAEAQEAQEAADRLDQTPAQAPVFVQAAQPQQQYVQLQNAPIAPIRYNRYRAINQQPAISTATIVQTPIAQTAPLTQAEYNTAIARARADAIAYKTKLHSNLIRAKAAASSKSALLNAKQHVAQARTTAEQNAIDHKAHADTAAQDAQIAFEQAEYDRNSAQRDYDAALLYAANPTVEPQFANFQPAVVAASSPCNNNCAGLAATVPCNNNCAGLAAQQQQSTVYLVQEN